MPTDHAPYTTSLARLFRLVDIREGADIVVTVVERGVGSETYGERLRYTEYYNNAVLTSTPVVANTFWVAAVMEVGTYRKEFTGAITHGYKYSGGAWGECSKEDRKGSQVLGSC